MLNLNEIKIGKVLQIDGSPYIVIKAGHHKMGRGGAVLKTKLKNLITGNILDKTFQGNERAEAADTQQQQASFMYQDEKNAHFMNNETYEQCSLPLEQIGDRQKFLKEGIDVDILYFNAQPVAVELPVKVALRVVSAPPAVKGNSAGSVTKQIKIETGAIVNAPLFISEGDLIIINTETGEYVERAN